MGHCIAGDVGEVRYGEEVGEVGEGGDMDYLGHEAAARDYE